ncbi:MAG: hypothetical protein HKO72_01570 [Flavobacteriaceae bacterium]|nr:hypothetical protein [Bacteroidia bacterium]NNL60004.1 hypothetical protein [Flavobacteriaceae bacterium]
MKAISRVIPSLFFLAVILAGCSRKKNTFIGRNFHAVTAEYNALYNGYNALEDGRSSLNESYNDNYWELLPIERMQVSEEISLPGQSKNPNFERAEEKAVKAIQKHAIKVQGKEYNPQMDEAYLLLGKARYFDQRFVPALDAFNNILNDYPTSDKINQVKIWREKTNIRLENDEVAIKNLKRLLEQEELEKQDLADATSMLAQAYINTKSLDSALMQMKVASIATKDNEEKGRYNFIKGQLYNMLEFRDSANIAFDEVIELNRKTPRIYMISAYIEKAKNFDYEDGNKLEFLEHLTDLEENRENRPFLDKIYHQIAVFHETNESDTLATKYYNKSLRALSQDRYLQSRNYLALGDMNFDNAQYQMAGAYYDSTMTKLVENSKPYRIIKRKRDNLDDVILYELGSQRNDSILNLVSLSDEDRLAFFESYIADLKAKAEAEKEREAIAERNKGLIQDGQTLGNRIGQERESGEPFYFYNATSVAFGKNEFIKVWGDRPLEDNWRSSGQGISSLANASEDSAMLTASEEELMDPEFYISKIPKDEKVIDSITRERNFAYYQLGLIYKEKFTEYELAKDKLQKLLRNGPEERLILPSKYNLFRIYELLGEPGEAEIMKNDIVSNYPDSRYASIINNPEIELSKDENSPESLYEALFRKHENQEYAEVISKSEEYINTFEGEDIVPKFEFLKATASGRLYGFDAYKKAIEFIALNYPNSPEGKRAEMMSNLVFKKIAKKDFVDDKDATKCKVIYPFSNATFSEVEEFNKILAEVTADVKYYELSTSIDVYDKNTTFVVVHGLKSIEGAKGFAELLEEEKYKITKSDYFAISSKNYEILQIHKNLNTYLESQ